MHAWDPGPREQYPGWHRAVEFFPRAEAIVKDVFPPLLAAVRSAGFKVFHVVSGGKSYKEYSGYRRAVELAGPEPPPLERVSEAAARDPVFNRQMQFRNANVHVGTHNEDDVWTGFRNMDFPPEARPVGDEGIAETERQLFALCHDADINHLIYMGFALNWCMLLSPGGMWDMQARGLLCSVFREATTAVENKETARQELAKELGLWRVALAFGFVFDVDDFLNALPGSYN